MRTTIEIPDELFRAAKIKAAAQGISLKDMVSKALRMVVEEDDCVAPTKGIKGPLPFVAPASGRQFPFRTHAELMASLDSEEES